MDPVIVTEEKLETGLRGIPVGYCTTSTVHPQKGLSYGGYYIDEISNKEPLDVVYLLLNKELPTADQSKTFSQDITTRAAQIPAGLDEYLKALPKQGHPMKWFLSGLTWLGMTGGKNDYREDCLNLISWMPELAAKIICIREETEPGKSDPSLGYIENFISVLNRTDLDQTKLTRLMKVFNVLHMDHGGGNLSAFVGKAVASGLEDMYGSIVGAMAALSGPRHGKANQECLDFIKFTLEALDGKTDDREAMLKFLAKRWDNKELIYGFGHAVLREEDPRATVLFKLGEEICPDDAYFRLANTLRKVGSEFLKTKEKVSDPYVNVDSASGSLLHACGLTNPDYYTLFFGQSRAVGIAIQVVYERLEAREGKGTPIIRPKYLYSGTTR